MTEHFTPHGSSDEESVARLQSEVAALRDRLATAPGSSRSRELEQQILQLQSSVGTLSAQNERLARTLKEAREQIVNLKSEVDRLAQPPATFGVVLTVHDDGTADILNSGRKMRVAVSPSVDGEQMVAGREVMLNEALNVVAAVGFENIGELVLSLIHI